MLKNKNIILTGANGGIGFATLNILSQKGANIFACARKKDAKFEDTIIKLEKEYNVKIIPIYFDITKKDELKNAIKQIRSYKIPIDGLVNNAGAIFTNLFTMTPIENFHNMFEINYFSQIEFTQHIVKLMMRQKSGSIVNISSSAAIFANEGRSAYAAAKSALITSSKVLAKEVGNYNIRVNVVAPGLTDTKMMRESTPENALKDTVDRLCLKRVAKPIEIANVVLFLLSDMSSYMTSQVISVDGGM